MMLGFYSVDITIDDDDKPTLIEINGSNSGFDGFLIAYEDTSVQDAISAAFRTCTGERDIYVVTQLANTGELPKGYLDKLLQDVMYFRSVENVHAALRKGVAGTTWARMRTDRAPSTMGAGNSLDALLRTDRRFHRVMLDVADPSYVIPSEYFKDDIERGVISFKDTLQGSLQARRLRNWDVVWFRSPTLAFAEPMAKGILVNAEYPYDAVADNKLLTYDVLRGGFAEHIPVSLPVGNRCSGSDAIEAMLAQSGSGFFIRKPLLGSQARGIEIFRRQDIVEYARRIKHLEEQDQHVNEGLPLELRGVPDLLAAGVLHFDISLLSELTLSKAIHCRPTGRRHYGCMRTLALVQGGEGRDVEVHFLGGYWRLAAVPVDSDGLLWERFVGSQSQGAFCEPVSAHDMAIAEKFAKDVLAEYCRRVTGLPDTRDGFVSWETAYWLERYRQQVPALQGDAWPAFMIEVERMGREAAELKQRAETSGFRKSPAAFLTRDELARTRFPYLIKEPQRLVIR